jgi:two-component system NtrC family sensor kinase
MSIVYTIRERCTGCYACVRNCPAKAIRIREGLAEVVKERCIDCGYCVDVCVTQAKQVESDVELVRQMLSQHSDVIALLSSSFPAALIDCRPGQLVSALKKLGFSEVMEDAFGAELVGLEYIRYLSENPGLPIISSNCPAVVSYVEKYHPSLLNQVAPIVSPMVAMGRAIKRRYNPQAKVVFVAPCFAKKVESMDEPVAGVVDAVLTFAELKDMFAARGIVPTDEEEGQFAGPEPNLGRLFAASGGLLKVMGLSDDIVLNDVMSVHGREYVVRILDEFAGGQITARFANLYFCHGCIDGPFIDNELSGFRRKEIIAQYTRDNADAGRTEKDIRDYADIDLSRQFIEQAVSLSQPTEKDIRKVEAKLGGTDCGACGYNSCHELAVSICQGMAETKMCWPYVLRQLKTTQDGLIQAEKLTSLGQLSASIAHEVNNPLSGVLIYTQLLEKKIASDQFSKEASLNYLSKMESELTRSTRLIQNLLDFSRQSPPTLRPVSISDVVDKAFELAAHSAELQNIEVIKELNPSLPDIMADFDQLQQVCTNLILNAVQAMPDGGKLNLRASTGDSFLKIAVQDTGCGISQDNIHKLFTPFFTTKVKGKGVGLGLAVAHGIIERHKGRIEVQSKEGEGTTFTIFLPISHEEREAD